MTNEMKDMYNKKVNDIQERLKDIKSEECRKMFEAIMKDIELLHKITVEASKK